jgi:MFS transporter, DHA2 family, multidrug resistance protein
MVASRQFGACFLVMLATGAILLATTQFLPQLVQPKYLIIAGAVFIALSMYSMTNVYGDLGFWFMARSRMLLGVALPLIFVPIMAASYDGISAI